MFQVQLSVVVDLLNVFQVRLATLSLHLLSLLQVSSHILCSTFVVPLYINTIVILFSASFYVAFLSTGIATSNNEMGGACGMYGGRERYAQGFGGET